MHVPVVKVLIGLAGIYDLANLITGQNSVAGIEKCQGNGAALDMRFEASPNVYWHDGFIPGFWWVLAS